MLEYKKFYANDTLYTYDEPNQLYQYTYDNLGRNFAVDVNDIDAANVDTYLYDYDDQGQITEVNTPQGTVYYDYNDVTGRKISTSTAETQVDYTYDHLGRLNTTKLVKRNGTTVSEQTSYTYNAVGSRAGMTLPNGVTTDYTYDALNRLTHIAHANSVDTIASYTYTLAADGKRTHLAEILDRPGPNEPEDNIIDYTYDKLSRITREHADANGTSDSYQIDYEYSIVGNRLKRIVSTGGPTLTTRCEYDPNTDQLIKELHNGPELAFLWQNRRVYAYAPQGRITHYQIQGRPGSIGPFKASILGLPSIWSRYIFIAVMALLAVAFFAPALMSLLFSRKSSRPPTHLSLWRRCLCVLLAYVMLISPVGFETLARADTLYSSLETTDWHSGDRTINYSYDQNGSLASKTTIETSDPNNVLETVTYDYNLQNRLEQITREYTEDNNDIDEITEYTYNPDGIRIKSVYNKYVNDELEQGSSETKIFLIDSYNHTGYAQVLEEWDTTSTPTLIKTYTIGDDVITQATSTSIEHLLYDGHGSTRQLVDNSEDITAAYSYDAYGNLLGGNPTPSSPAATNMLYAGEQYDSHLQQYYLRARYYNPLNGTFNRVDPFTGNMQDPQSLHKYLYCHANPVNGIDPSGESLRAMVDLVNAISIRVMLFAMELAPKLAAYTWMVTKIAGLTFLMSTIYLGLESEGWVPETGITKEIQMASGAIFFAGFILTGALQSIPAPQGKVPYGKTSLSRQVQGVRLLKKIGVSPEGTIRNGAAFEYRGGDGRLHTLIRFSQRGGGGHAERVIRDELIQMQVSPSQVTQIYSELQPCSVPRSLSCDLMIGKEFPHAQVTWSYDYQNELTQAESQASVDLLKEGIQALF